MNRWSEQVQRTERSWFTPGAICQPHEPACEPREHWDEEVTAYVRRIVQQQCSAATVEHRRSDGALAGVGREVDLSIRYPAGSHDEVQAALDALGMHWSIYQATEQPVYLTVLHRRGRPYYVHLYDVGMISTANHTDRVRDEFGTQCNHAGLELRTELPNGCR